MEDLTNQVLSEEEKFMLGSNLDELKITSYLQTNDLIKVSCKSKGTDRTSLDYFLKENGKVSINYNQPDNITQVIIRNDTPKYIIEDLRKIGELSRGEIK